VSQFNFGRYRGFIPLIPVVALSAFIWPMASARAESPGGGASATAPAKTGAPAVAQSLCDALIGSMKRGAALDFAGRSALLDPEVRRDFDLPFMTRIVVGPPWRELGEADRAKLVDAFSTYSVATYAQRFKDYSGERFEVDPSATPLPNGDCIVHTKLFPGGGAPVQLDYLMRKGAANWRIIDVYLNGSISELAARRSEYSTVLRKGGAAALITLLQDKSAAFAH